MKPRKPKITDDQIEAETLAKRTDVSAWEVLPFVPPSTSPRPAWMSHSKHLDLAAKFHVLSVLHRLGAEANLALGQPDNVDVAILDQDGQAITIDVKVVEGADEWRVEHFRPKEGHYVAVVAFGGDNAVSQPHVYVVASAPLHEFVSSRQLTSLPLDVLRREFDALDAWQLVVPDRAA